MTRVIVCGSRGWSDRATIADRLAAIVLNPAHDFPFVIVHGNARGADRLAAELATQAGFDVEPHPAAWEGLGKRAGYVRNEQMAALGADLCIAFWDGQSRGTRDMIDRAEAHGIPVEIVRAS